MPKHKGDKPSRPNRTLQMKEDQQEYAKVVKALGNRLLQVECNDGRQRQAIIRGSMSRGEWISVGDLILVSIRDFQDTKCDVILKYTPGEVHSLKKLGELGPEKGEEVERRGDGREGGGGGECSFSFEDI